MISVVHRVIYQGTMENHTISPIKTISRIKTISNHGEFLLIATVRKEYRYLSLEYNSVRYRWDKDDREQRNRSWGGWFASGIVQELFR